MIREGLAVGGSLTNPNSGMPGMERSSAVTSRNACRGHSTSGPRRGAVVVKKEFTEPVALLSTQPADLPLPRTALGRSFDLLALRARCEREPTYPAQDGQERLSANDRTLRRFSNPVALHRCCPPTRSSVRGDVVRPRMTVVTRRSPRVPHPHAPGPPGSSRVRARLNRGIGEFPDVRPHQKGHARGV